MGRKRPQQFGTEWEERSDRIVREMESYLETLVERGCPRCEQDGSPGIAYVPRSGGVCDHIADRWYRTVKRRIRHELQVSPDRPPGKVMIPAE